MKERLLLIAVSAGTALVTVVITTAVGFALFTQNPSFFSRLLGVIPTTEKTLFVPESSSSIVKVVKKTNPAVVAITISKNVPVYRTYFEEIPNFFGEGELRIPQVRQEGSELQEIGGGSGFLVSEDGYIVTNRHVVIDEEATYTVFTNEGEEYNATVIARDTSLDLAVLKIEGSGFSFLTFRDSDTLTLGETVIAIGNALGEFRNTISVGVISGLSRSIVASDASGGFEVLDQLIQTDAGINVGNSGGPLLDIDGNVIGVNVARANDADNIGFALSANSVRNVVDSVRETGRIVRPFLGIRYVPITDVVKEQEGLSVDEGILILGGSNPDEPAVLPGSPAEKAGIKERDIVLEIDGVKLTEETSLAGVIRTKKVGQEVMLKLLSGKEEKTVSVTLEEMP